MAHAPTSNAMRAPVAALPQIDRSASFARQAQLSAFIDKVMEPQLLQSPDERIEAAVEEIKLAYREKYPNAPIYVRDLDNITEGCLIFLTNVQNQAPGTIDHERVGSGWRARGGERTRKGGAV